MPLAATEAPARVFARPKLIAIACIGVLVAAGWIYLGLMVGQSSILAALCQPSFSAARPSAAESALILSMWCAMALAMMLPTAAPMIMTYADIAQAAAEKGERVASPLTLAAGYMMIWLAAAVALSTLQILLTRLALLDPAMASASPLFTGAMFAAAGAYQFSTLKHACVTQCQSPMPFFFANWTAEPRGIFRLGLRQGLYCLGCCWAMMLLMFAVGVMNVVWMAALGIIMTVEKLGAASRFSRAIGAVFLAIGASFIMTSLMAHWPR